MPTNKVNNNIKLKSGGGVINDANGLSVDSGTTAGKIVAMATGDKLPAVDGSQLTNLPPSIFQQDVAYPGGAMTLLRTTSSLDGSILICASETSDIQLTRFLRDTTTGLYTITHTVNVNVAGTTQFCTPMIIGSYVYLMSTDSSAQQRITRFNLADLTGEQAITISGTTFTPNGAAFGDGTSLYAFKTTNEYYKFTISGTTATNAATITYNSSGNSLGALSDASGVYITDTAVNGTITIRKYDFAGGAATATYTKYFPKSLPQQSASITNFYIPKTGLFGLAEAHSIESASATTGFALKLSPFTLS